IRQSVLLGPSRPKATLSLIRRRPAVRTLESRILMLNGTVPGLSDSHEEQRLPAATCVGSAAKPASGGSSWWKSFWSMPGKPEKFLGWPATIFILTQLAGGLPLLPYAMLHWQAA